jgi:hypothetical protein
MRGLLGRFRRIMMSWRSLAIVNLSLFSQLACPASGICRFPSIEKEHRALTSLHRGSEGIHRTWAFWHSSCQIRNGDVRLASKGYIRLNIQAST